MKIQNFKNKLKNLFLILKGKSLLLKTTVNINHEWYGNKYGGFYVNTENINKNSIIYSFGIGEDASFDMQLINKFKCNIFGFDPTPKSIKWIESQQLPSSFIFSNFGIGNETRMVSFYLPQNHDHVSGSVHSLSTVNVLEPIQVPMRKLKDIVAGLNHMDIDIIKMDIEGSEYEVIPDILNSGIVIKQILIEFHHRMFTNGGRLTKDTISLLKDYGFELFAFSSTYEELSFINIKYIKLNTPVKKEINV